MPIDFPSNRKLIIDQIKSDIQAELPGSAPFLQNAYIGSQLVAYGGRVYEFYLQLTQVLREMFPDTATGVYLERWGALKRVTKNPATQASGLLTATGTTSSVIPIGTLYQSTSGNTYTTQASVTLINTIVALSSLTFSAGTANATTVSPHSLATGTSIIITGAVETEYNGTFVITVTSQSTFTYSIAGTPSSPATGTPVGTYVGSSVEVLSDDFGFSQNLDQGAALSLSSPIGGVSTLAYVQFTQVAGGTDVENDDDYRIRVLYAWQNPNTPFNRTNIINTARRVSGVTRVFVEEPDTTTGTYSINSITRTGVVATVTTASSHGLVSGSYVSISGALQVDYNVSPACILVTGLNTFIYLVANNPATPATGILVAAFSSVQPGQTKVTFTRDNDTNIIPSGEDVDNVKEQLLTIKPAHMSAQDLIVEAPEGILCNFLFSNITPNTLTMKNAINDTLEAFFRRSTVVGQNLTQDAYRSAIYNTIDTETGQVLEAFGLTSPSGNITILSGQLPVLGTVAFP